MNFSDLRFIFIFLPLFIILYRLLPARFRPYIMILGSLLFYTLGTWDYLWYSGPVIILLACVQYGIYRLRIFTDARHVSLSLPVRVLTVVLAVVPLAVCKILGCMPLGISFFTFQVISLQADLWKDREKEIVKAVDFFAFLFAFPKLTMGPIARFGDVLPDFSRSSETDQRLTAESLEEGLKLFTAGLALKVLLADSLASLWQSVNVSGAGAISVPVAWLGAIAYTMELYFDFWGYSVMAMGLGRCIGMDIPVNFNDPYISTGVGEFWRRWHITLGTWFRDYIYIPLGGSRCGKGRTLINLFIVWLLTGIWHGNGYNFIIWGLVLFLLIIIEKFTPVHRLYERNSLPLKILGHIYICLVMPVTWMIFAHSDIGQMLLYLGSMAGINSAGTVSGAGQFVRYLSDYGWLLLAGCILMTPYPHRLYLRFEKKLPAAVLLLILFWLSVIMIIKGNSNPFMYYQF